MPDPSLQEYFDAANAVYTPSLTVPSEFKLLTSVTLNSMDVNTDGFYALAFQNKTTGNIIIAYEGSTPSPNPTDWLIPYVGESNQDDLDLLGGKIPAALGDAVNFAKEVQREFGGLGSIYVTGHSLGGAEAEAVAQASAQGKLSISGGATFGAPGLPGYSGPSNQDNFINYVNYGDPVGNYATDAKSELSNLASEYGNLSHFGTVDLIGSSLDKYALLSASIVAELYQPA